MRDLTCSRGARSQSLVQLLPLISSVLIGTSPNVSTRWRYAHALKKWACDCTLCLIASFSSTDTPPQSMSGFSDRLNTMLAVVIVRYMCPHTPSPPFIHCIEGLQSVW